MNQTKTLLNLASLVKTSFKINVLLVILALTSLTSVQSQVMVNGKVYFVQEDKVLPTVKVLKDNLPFKEFKTNESGKFTAKLPVGHDYMFEISKPYSLTTRLAVSTKFPKDVDTKNLYEEFTVETDLIPHYEGLDASIMNYPVLILRFDEDDQGFANDTMYLNTIRQKVGDLLAEIETIEKKGVKKSNSKLPKKEMKRIDLTEFLAKNDEEMIKELEALNEPEKEEVKKAKKEEKESEKTTKDLSEKSDDNNNSTKSDALQADLHEKQNMNASSNTSSTKNIKNNSEKSSANSTSENSDIEKTKTTENLEEETVDLESDTLIQDSYSSEIRDKQIADEKADLSTESDLEEVEDYNEPFYEQTWFYLLIIGVLGLIFFLLYRNRKTA